ncbi:hypothetical protein [Streptomyces sp. NPDC003032]
MSLTSKPIQRAVERGWDALCGYTAGLPYASVCLSIDFGDPLPLTQARDLIRYRLGPDVGIDLAEEGFTAMLALDHLPLPAPTQAQRLLDALAGRVEACVWGNRYRFFLRVPQFAADTDCTAVAAAALHRHHRLTTRQFQSKAAEILRAKAPRRPEEEDLLPGAVMVYWDDAAEPHALPRGCKQDAVVSANVLRTLILGEQHTTRAGHPIAQATLAHVGQHLLSGNYLSGTRYYPSPASFLLAVARLCAISPYCARRLSAPLRRANATVTITDALDMALLTIAADHCGDGEDQMERRERLAASQRPDGLWPAGAYFRMGRVPAYFGSPQLTTVFALRALQPSIGEGSARS